MASLYKKIINGKPYYYLREMGWVDGKPKMVSERYLGSAADIVAAMDRAEAGHDAGTDPASAVRGRRRGVVVADRVGRGRGDRRGGRRPPLRRRARRSGRTWRWPRWAGWWSRGPRRRFADFWAATAGDRFTKISPKVLDHRKFWDAMHAVDTAALQEISTRLAARMIDVFDLDTSSVALDMTNFATYIDTTNDKAPIAQRGKAKQKRTDLRLVGLGMVVTRAGGIPLVWHAYPGNRPDVTQFPTLIDHLTQRYATSPAPTPPTAMPDRVDAGGGDWRGR